MKKIERDRAIIHYTATGHGDITLLFVHGSYIDQTYWENQVNYFSPRYKVVTIDLPGHGLSGRGRTNWTLEGYAEDVAVVIKELGLKKVILIGHSFAGEINLIAATSHPQHIIGFVAVDYFKNAATPLTEEGAKQVAGIIEGLKTNFTATNELYARNALLTPGTPQWLTDKIVKAYQTCYEPMGLPVTIQGFAMCETEQQLLPKLKPTLYLLNVDYLPTNTEPLDKYAKNGYKLVNMHGTSHYPMVEHPDEFNALLQGIIDEIAVG